MLFSFTHPSVLNTSKVTNVFIPGSSSNSEHPDKFFDGEKRQGRSSGGIERFEFEIVCQAGGELNEQTAVDGGRRR